MRKPRIEIASDAQDLASRAARLFAFTAGQAIQARGVFRTALSGGHTPELFFQRLIVESEAGAIPWDRVQVFWVDERYVPADSRDSNYRLAAEAFLNRIDIPQANVHRIPTERDSIDDAVRVYERTMREVFGLKEGQMPRFDLIVLGMGADGHTASLFPNSPIAYEAADLACVAYPGAGAKPQVNRITLTPPVLLAARKLVVLISGREKAQTLKEVFTGEPEAAKYPIRVLWPALDRITWLVDREAAAEIGEA